MKPELKTTGETEFSRVLDISNMEPGKRYDFDFSANANERNKLADRCKIRSIDKFNVSLRVNYPVAGPSIFIEGSFEASITQSCIVSLEDVPQSIKATFDLECMDESLITEEYEEEDFEDFIEPISNNKLDLAEIATQYLALEIDPYPRKKGAEADVTTSVNSAAEKAEDTQRPFENLSELLKKSSE